MFELKITTDNAAFADGMAGHEVARILENVVNNLDDGERTGRLYDINGNDVGEWSLT